MMAGNPNWWSIHPPSLFPQYAHLGSSSLSLNPLADNQEPQQPWSQLQLAKSSAGDDERFGLSNFHNKKLEIWEDQILNPSPRVPVLDEILKQEVSQNNLYDHGEEEFHAPRSSAWSQIMPVSSPRSYVTSFTNNHIFDISYNKVKGRNYQHPDHPSEIASTTAGGRFKKARIQSSSSQPPLKVRKEKLGDKITALHQLVSPFGKTDTASVLLEAMGYIRFLLGQIEALSSPYLGNTSKDPRNQQCDTQDLINKPKDLRNRGLCLVPTSCTQHVGSENNGADYWAPTFGSGF
ncbi:transcription factor bHLH68-like [Juglans microcarpa x Juglans regia]|uniref:transcription factor bHLH68-like n=1 Tax=Juglans microcarpa x Juglans regia TaxID=2249226 RepID=UPI001B7F4FCE|nr:transcription factor bHLH68-like [Juglans microcarpa x Juglans regia]